MKKIVTVLLFVIAAMATTTPSFAQVNDTLWVYNVDIDERIVFESEFTFNEVDSLIMKSRVAFLDDAKEMIWYYFKDQGIRNDFWQNTIQRYIEWPQKAEVADALDRYYHPKSIIYVPTDDYVNAIAFDWSSGKIKIAIFSEDGLWTTTESLGDKWEVFIDDSFVKMIINMEDEP